MPRVIPYYYHYGLLTKLTITDKGGEGVQTPPNMADIICEQSLSRCDHTGGNLFTASTSVAAADPGGKLSQVNAGWGDSVLGPGGHRSWEK